MPSTLAYLAMHVLYENGNDYMDYKDIANLIDERHPTAFDKIKFRQKVLLRDIDKYGFCEKRKFGKPYWRLNPEGLAYQEANFPRPRKEGHAPNSPVSKPVEKQRPQIAPIQDVKPQIEAKKTPIRSKKKHASSKGTPSFLLSDEAAPPYIPQDGDTRLLVQRQICDRRGQQPFRNALRKRYGDTCLVTGCKVLSVLEAAHINPYRGERDNRADNGLLLRADIHTIFDLDLLGIEPDSLLVEIHPDIVEEYGYLSRKAIGFVGKSRPSREALEKRYKLFRTRMSLPA